MNATGKNSKEVLEAAVEAMRSCEPDRTEMENRAARVWAGIGREHASQRSTSSSVDQIRGCEDYRALIPDYIAGHLSSSRALLFKDHTHECVDCRNTLDAARGGAVRPK